MNQKIKLSLLLFVALCTGVLQAQNVGIGTATPLAKLHVAGNARINSLAGVGTRMVASDVNGTLVNIAAGTTGQVLTQTVGGPAWQNAGGGWLTTGNAGTNVATNFMGSTDNNSVAFRTNNIETFRMTNGQRVGIGITAPTVKLEVSSGTGDAVFGHSSSVGGYLGYETNFSIGTPAQNLNGAGVYASNPAAGYTSIFGQSTGSATVAAMISYSNVWMAAYNYVDNSSGTYNPSACYNQLNVTSTTLGGFQAALRGYSDKGTTSGNIGYTIGTYGTAVAQNQDGMGAVGNAFCSGGLSFGGYFEGNNYTGTNYAYAYVGGTANGGVTLRKIIGSGTVSEIIPTANHGRITLTAPESPEYWYQDYGTVELVNGQAHVDLDPITADIIVVDKDNPIRVFATPVNMLYFNGVTVMNQTATGFDLVELNGGNHSGELHYQLVMKPKTNFGEGRYPQAPGPGYLKPDLEPAAAKAANQPKAGQVFRWPSDQEQYGYDPAEMVGIGDRVPAGPHAGKIKVGEGKFIDYVPAEKPAN
ncbi:MAG: hypothetical protein H6581_09940 [Bacteroidia bacterium]|nr:hypothetical protein [Bacteroidia bacterium]